MNRRPFYSRAVEMCALIFAMAGCAEATHPTEIAVTVPGPPAPQFVPTFPPLSQPGRIYAATNSLYGFTAGGNGSGLASRYVLYDNGSFALQFSSFFRPFSEYPGRYTTVSSLITFAFDVKTWEATATLRGDSLVVRYNDDALSSEFQNGVYVRSPGQ